MCRSKPISASNLGAAGMSAMGRGCVKTSIESQFVPRLRDLGNLQFAKALISLRLEFRLLRQNHNSNSSSTFSHSLGRKQKSYDVWATFMGQLAGAREFAGRLEGAPS